MSDEILHVILNEIQLINKDIGEVKQTMATKEDLAGVRAEMKEDLDEVRAEMAEEFTKVRAEMDREFGKTNGNIAEMKTDIVEMKADIAEMKKKVAYIPAMKVAILEIADTVNRLEAKQEKQDITISILARRTIENEEEIKKIKLG